MIILAGLYFSIVIYMSMFETCKYIWIIPMMTFFMSLVLKECLDYILVNKISVTEKHIDHKFKLFLLCFIIIFAMQIVYWLAYFPGGFNLDAYGQWDQVHGLMQWNNWHPVLTTLIYWILTRIVDSLAFCIFIQILVFSISVSLVLLELYSHDVSKKLILICALYIAINPAIGMNNVCLIKDVPFAICVVWMFWGILKVYYSNGEWLKILRGDMFFFCEIVVLSLIRHNAVLLIVPFIVMLLYNYRKMVKNIIITFVSGLIILWGVETIIFPIANIEQHSNVVGEMVGVPMAAMANALVTDYENTPDSVKEFLEDIADVNDWNAHYYTGEWDSCKWEFGGVNLLKGESLSKVVYLFFETLKSCPEAVYSSFRENTRVVWQMIGYNDWNTWVYIETNDYGIEEKYNMYCTKIAEWLEKMSNTLIGSTLSWNTGFDIAVLVLVLLYVERNGNKKLNTIILAILSYDFLTMLLLAGPSHRYFYFNSVLVLPIMLVALSKNESK